MWGSILRAPYFHKPPCGTRIPFWDVWQHDNAWQGEGVVVTGMATQIGGDSKDMRESCFFCCISKPKWGSEDHKCYWLMFNKAALSGLESCYRSLKTVLLGE